MGTIEAVTARRSFAIRGGLAERYIAPRVALIGDAAHLIHPLAGQGLNLGLADAATLAGILVDEPRDPGSLRVLRRYERARRTDNALMLKLTEGLDALFKLQLPALPALRAAGMRTVDAAAPLKRLLIQKASGARLAESGDQSR